ncbi:MAG: hypothetical protein IMX05_05740 [Hydrogenibacillus schlegelii]|nr:hypothetical protein [Hydrogenibacillus schlegelii]
MGRFDFFRRRRRDVKAVESWRHELIPEEFPEGPYGAPREMEVGGEWHPDDTRLSAFQYENRELHESIPRHLPPVDETYGEADNDESPKG